jgi:UDP-hydrolysing UDP-N-acetyl-D-glucosamine 2-epimerase
MRVAVLTSGRQDWGILRSTCIALDGDARFELLLLVGGMHLADGFGHTSSLIAESGLVPVERLDWIVDGANATSQASAVVEVVGAALDRLHPDVLLLVGDRFETAAAALAATLSRVPIAHIHGGEVTSGAIDDALRNAITKLSHLHLVSHEEHADRVVAMGEDPETVHVVGAPGLDNVHRDDLPSRDELERLADHRVPAPMVLVTLQPTTLASQSEAAAELASILAAMAAVPATYVVSLPNNDPGHEPIRTALRAAAKDADGVAVEALGDRSYWGMLKTADAMLGNSSSGIIEAPVVNLPAVNVGSRQRGRVRGANVIDVDPPSPDGTIQALRTALTPATRQRLRGAASPFGDGRSAGRILSILAGWTPPKPPVKRPLALARA